MRTLWVIIKRGSSEFVSTLVEDKDSQKFAGNIGKRIDCQEQQRASAYPNSEKANAYQQTMGIPGKSP